MFGFRLLDADPAHTPIVLLLQHLLPQDVLVQLSDVLLHLCLPFLPLADSSRQIIEVTLTRLHTLGLQLVSRLRHYARIFDSLGLFSGFGDFRTDCCPHF